MMVAWQASDADDDSMLFTVQYSPDAGSTWQPLATNYATTTLVLDDLGGIPGSSAALVRVIATDGVNTGTDTSDGTFSVDTQPPEAHISQPLDATVFPTGTQIILVGNAFDAEDGPLSGSSLQWSANGSPLGSGKELSMQDAAPGQYLIMLQATDSDAQTATDSVTIFVGMSRVYLPLTMRAP
jgi:hypothetical protein